MNGHAPQCEAVDFSAERVRQAIAALASPDKVLQCQANEFLERFGHSDRLRLDVIGGLLSDNHPTTNTYAWSLLSTQLATLQPSIASPEVSSIRQMAEMYLPKDISGTVWTRAVTRVVAYFVYKEMEEVDFGFWEQSLPAGDAEAQVRLLVQSNIAEFLKKGTFHSRKIRLIESEIRQRSVEISSQLAECVSRPALIPLALELISLLSSKVSFITYPVLALRLSTVLANTIQQGNSPATEAVLNTLTDLISNCEFSNLRETTNQATINATYLPLLLHLETQGVSELAIVSLSDSKASFTASLLLLVHSLDTLERHTPKSFIVLMSAILSHFNHLLLAPSATAAFLFAKARALLAFPGISQQLLTLGFEWLYKHLKDLLSEIEALSVEVLEVHRQLLVAFAHAWLRSVVHPNPKTAKDYFGYYMHRKTAEEYISEVVEDRSSAKDVLGDLCIQWKSVFPFTFLEDLGTVMQSKLAETGNLDAQILNLEGVVFLLNTTLPVLVEEENGITFLKNVLHFVSGNSAFNNEGVVLGLTWLAHELSVEQCSDPQLQASLLLLTCQILSGSGYPVLDRMAAEAFNNIIKEAKNVTLDFSETQQRIHIVVFEKIRVLLATITEQELKRFDPVVATTTSAYLSLLRRMVGDNPTQNLPKLTEFLQEVALMFDPLLAERENQKALFVFVTVFKAIIDAYEVEKDLNEVTQNDMLFGQHIEAFARNTIALLLARFDEALASRLLCVSYYQMVRDIVSKFSDSDVHYFETLFPLCLRMQTRDQLRMTLLDKIVLLNADNSVHSAFLNANCHAIDATLLGLFTSDPNSRLLTRNEDFEAEFVTFQSTLITHYQSAFYASEAFPVKLDLIGEFFRAANTHGLVREILRF